MARKKEVNKLYTNQKKLEDTKKRLQTTTFKYKKAKSKLNNLQSDLNEAKKDYSRAEKASADRIKQIYKGERLNLLHLIINSKDINTFLDRVYYQKLISNKDKNLLDTMRNKADRLENVKNKVAYQQNNILYSLNKMNRQKKYISKSINNSQYMINKLRTDRATYEQAQIELAKQSGELAKMITEDTTPITAITPPQESKFIKPVSGRISSNFGWRRHPIFKSRSFHSGVDIAGRNRYAIKATNSGKVIYSGWYGGYGKVVILNHGNYKGNPTTSLYAHMYKTAVNVGDKVKKGQTVGYEGTTGYSTGPHLHFEIRVKGRPTNPLTYIQ